MFTCTAVDENSAGSAGCFCCRPALQSAERRITNELSRRGVLTGAVGALASVGFAPRAKAAAPRPRRPTVFTNFQLFDGKSSNLRSGVRLLIEDGRIRDVASSNPGAPDGARLIDCGGRVLMPGLIDAHWHTMFAGLPIMALMTADIGFIVLAASAQAERTLMRGFTTVRDLGDRPSP